MTKNQKAKKLECLFQGHNYNLLFTYNVVTAGIGIVSYCKKCNQIQGLKKYEHLKNVHVSQEEIDKMIKEENKRRYKR